MSYDVLDPRIHYTTSSQLCKLLGCRSEGELMHRYPELEPACKRTDIGRVWEVDGVKELLGNSAIIERALGVEGDAPTAESDDEDAATEDEYLNRCEVEELAGDNLDAIRFELVKYAIPHEGQLLWRRDGVEYLLQIHGRHW